MAEKQKALKGRRLRAGRGPGRGPRGSPQASIPQSQGPEKVAWGLSPRWVARAPPGSLQCPGLSRPSQVSHCSPTGLRTRGVRPGATRPLVFPALPPAIPALYSPRGEEAGVRSPGQSWVRAELGVGGVGALRGQRPLSLSLPSPQAQCNHLVSGKGKGFSYQRKLKVTLFLIDLAMFVNYSVTDVAKDN